MQQGVETPAAWRSGASPLSPSFIAGRRETLDRLEWQQGVFLLAGGDTDDKTPADRPASQPTNQPHHIWKVGRRTDVVTGLVRPSRPPIFGWEVTPDKLLCTPDHPLRDLTMHPSLGMRSEDRPIAILAFLERFPHF